MTLSLALDVAFPSDVVARHYANGKSGGLTIDGALPAPLGQKVELTVRIQKPSRTFVVLGQLAWARHRSSKNLKESFGVDFAPEDDASRLRLLAFARQEVHPEATRLWDRVATDLPVKLIHNGRTLREHLVDLSLGGAFIRSGTPLAVGEAVEMIIRPPRTLLGLHLKGRVAWLRQTGTAVGMGVQFSDDSAEQRSRLEKLLARLTG
jgi:uncharacterized protein (TIGR02266 family)